MADRPDIFPEWALTDLNDPVTGEPNKAPISNEIRSSGLLRQQPLARAFINEQFDLIDQWTKYFDEAITTLMGGIGANPTEAAYPVGSIYLTLSSSPAVPFSFGEWELIGQGRTLIGQDVTDSDFDGLGEEGGTKSHSHSDTFAVDGHSLDLTEIPEHSHSSTSTIYLNSIKHSASDPNPATGNAVLTIEDEFDVEGSTPYPSTEYASDGFAGPEGGDGSATPPELSPAAEHMHNLSGAISSSSNLPPYLVVKMWRRVS